MHQTCVYQAFNRHGRVLYVGLSKHWPNRWVGHSRTTDWWQEVVHLRVVWLNTPREAHWLEGYYIQTLHPQYNIKIPQPIEAPDTLTTHCSLCPTSYAAALRPPGSQCEDLSLKPWTEAMTESELLKIGCHGICELPLNGKWECLA